MKRSKWYDAKELIRTLPCAPRPGISVLAEVYI